MVSLAKENLLRERSKIALSVGGVVLAVFLIFATTGLYYAISAVVDNMVMKAGADLWVTSKGSSGSLHSPSLPSNRLASDLKEINGIQKVSPLIRRPIATDMNGEQVLVSINGFDTVSGLGGPWKVVEGKSTPRDGEAIVDRVLAQKKGLGIGDSMELEGKRFEIVGISDETFTLISYMVFVTLEDARSFMPGDLTNFFLVTVKAPGDVTQVKQAIESNLPAVSVSTSRENAAQAKEETVGGFLPIVFVISAIGALVGVLVVGLLVYTMTIEKSREYGILRAIGAGNLYLYRIVLFQSLTVSILGFVIGAAISPPLMSGMQYLVPEFVSTITPRMMAWVFSLFVVTGLVASFIPVRRLSQIDPAVVFKQQ
ncbi:MAG: ABC transporter permease [Chloroflexi bacterium]|nr:ABC transporter permease [Chloroflexota bacterium]